MKKIIRAMFLFLALVIFTGTANAAATPKFTVNFVDTRVEGLEATSKQYNVGKVSNDSKLYTYLGLSAYSDTYLKIDENNNYQVFLGWYTSDGTKVEAKKDNAIDVDGIKVYSFSDSARSWLYFDASEVEEAKEITLYAKWSDAFYKATVDVHVYDDKAFANTELEHLPQYKKELPVAFRDGEGGSVTLFLDQVFTANNEYYTAFSNRDLRVDVKGTASYYTFLGWYDKDGNEIKEGYTSNVIKSVRVYDKGDRKNCLEITFKDSINANVKEDVDVNVYVKWEEFTTAILEHEYIDEVSTGSGSWKNVTGGTSSYTHTFSDPSEKTPKTHYEFLYWQHEKSDDEQVDSTKEYKDGDKFTYTLSNKPSGWEGKVTTYAWWQPDVTLNLYSDGKLISTESSFESVSVGQDPTKYGYTFLGWFDAEGNKVTENTFYAAEKGINPEVREYTLYAQWKRIMVDVKVAVVWDDKNDEDEIRPKSVTVELKDGEEVIETVELSEENNWTHTFNVPKYNTESEIEYTVSQNEVEFYTTTVDGSIEEGFVITNFHEAWPKGDTDYDEPEVVQTGSTVSSIYVSFMGLTSLGLLISRKKRLN